jgi:glycosyltransferase involved in cell wall biosynthesis
LRVSDRVVVLNDDELTYCRAERGLADERLIRSAPIVGAAFTSDPPPPATSDAVLVVGGDAWRKGALQHTRVIESAVRTNPSLRVGWIGRPPQHWWAELDETVRQRITVVGDYDPEHAGQLFSQYGVLVALSRFEGFGLTVLEGMSHGLVPIVTQTPGPSSFVTDGHNGFVVSVNADDEVTRALVLLRDGSLRHHMALEAWRTSQQFAAPRVARELGVQYEQAVAQKRGAQ